MSLRDLKPHFSLLIQAFLYVSFLNSNFLDFFLSLNPNFLFNFHFLGGENMKSLRENLGLWEIEIKKIAI